MYYESEVLSVIEQTLTAFDKIDNLINCAAIINDTTPFHLMTEDEWTNLMNVNLKGTFQPIKAVIPLMIEQRSGNIINISSLLGIRAITKGTIFSIWCYKGRHHNVNKKYSRRIWTIQYKINCIAPSTIRSPMMEPYLQDKTQKGC